MARRLKGIKQKRLRNENIISFVLFPEAGFSLSLHFFPRVRFTCVNKIKDDVYEQLA